MECGGVQTEPARCRLRGALAAGDVEKHVRRDVVGALDAELGQLKQTRAIAGHQRRLGVVGGHVTCANLMARIEV